MRKAQWQFLDAQLAIARAQLTNVPKANKAFAEAQRVIPLLRAQQRNLDFSEDYWKAVEQFWRIEGQVGRLAGSASEARNRMAEQARNQQAQLSAGNLGLVQQLIGLLPDRQQKKAGAALLGPALASRESALRQQLGQTRDPGERQGIISSLAGIAGQRAELQGQQNRGFGGRFEPRGRSKAVANIIMNINTNDPNAVAEAVLRVLDAQVERQTGLSAVGAG